MTATEIPMTVHTMMSVGRWMAMVILHKDMDSRMNRNGMER